METTMTYEERVRKLEESSGWAWKPASNGTETPFIIGSKHYLYMYNTSTGKHAYYCISDDKLLTDEDTRKIWG